MKWAEVIGQGALCDSLARRVSEGRVPHALMLTGKAGCGKLPVALALAQALLAEGGEQSADLADRYIHPDLHFVYPVKKRKGAAAATVSAHYRDEWLKRLQESAWFSFDEWMSEMKCENEQPMIYEAESAEIMQRLMMKSAMGGRKVMIIVWPERMHEVCANKLLKLIEEPPSLTHIIMVPDDTERILPTIKSRMQTVCVPPVRDYDIAVMLAQQYGLDEQQAKEIGHLACGSVVAARALLRSDSDKALWHDLFALLMRKAYSRDVKALQEWSQQMAEMGRERQKAFLQYAGGYVRENFIYNFQKPQLCYLSRQEMQFSARFARFINERNVICMMQEIDQAQRDIEQNVNAKMVFFDLAMQVTVLIKSGK